MTQTGAWHYKRAEVLLDQVSDGEGAINDAPHVIAAAQVHATLAVAGATADAITLMPDVQASLRGYGDDD